MEKILGLQSPNSRQAFLHSSSTTTATTTASEAEQTSSSSPPQQQQEVFPATIEDLFKQAKEDEHISKAIAEDENLVLCKTCGMQYDFITPPEANDENCKVCADPRQYIPESGQQWIKAKNWLYGETAKRHKVRMSLRRQDRFDKRVYRIVTESQTGLSVGIGQTPIVICSAYGMVIWDCSAFYTVGIFENIKALARQLNNIPILGIAISHPHFYTTALTWAKALNTKVYISKHDYNDWWMRKGAGTTREEYSSSSIEQQYLEAFETPTYELAPGLTIIQCGGHFPGSCVLHWDQAAAAGASASVVEVVDSSNKKNENSSSINNNKIDDDDAVTTTAVGAGMVFCADTFAPGMDREQITFMWSYPNFIPLSPKDILRIWHAVQPFAFDTIVGGWQGRQVEGQAKQKLLNSAKRFIEMEGHDSSQFDWFE